MNAMKRFWNELLELEIESRWKIFSGCLFISGVTGMATAYGLISPSLEEDLGLSPGEIALIGSFGNLGTFSGFVAGYLIDLVGPRRAVFIGSVAIWFGLFFIWLSVSKNIDSSVGALCLFIYVAQVGASTMSQAGSSTSMLIMPSESHGTVASLAKAYYGIAGAVLSSIAATAYDNDEKGFVLFASIFISVSTFVGGTLINFIRPENLSYSYERKRNIKVSFSPYYKHLVVLIIGILACAALYLSKNSGGNQFHQFVGSMVVIWMGCVLLIERVYFQPSDVKIDSFSEEGGGETSERKISVAVESMIAGEMRATKVYTHMLENEQASIIRSKSMESETPSFSASSLGVELLGPSASFSQPQQGQRTLSADVVGDEIAMMKQRSVSIAAVAPCLYGDDLPLIDMLKTGRFYAIFLIQSTHYGGTLLVINLIGSITTSQRVVYGPFLVLLISISSAFGRIAIGLIAERFKKQVSLVGIMAYCNLLVTVTSLLFACYIDFDAFYYFLVLCNGALYGSMTVLSAASVVQQFGVTYVATNDGMYDLSGAVGSYAVAYGAVALFPPPQNSDDDDGGCIGAVCYQKAFFFAAGVAFLGFLVGMATDMYLTRVLMPQLAERNRNNRNKAIANLSS